MRIFLGVGDNFWSRDYLGSVGLALGGLCLYSIMPSLGIWSIHLPPLEDGNSSLCEQNKNKEGFP